MALMLILICKGPSGRGLEIAAEFKGRELVEASVQARSLRPAPRPTPIIRRCRQFPLARKASSSSASVASLGAGFAIPSPGPSTIGSRSAAPSGSVDAKPVPASRLSVVRSTACWVLGSPKMALTVSMLLPARRGLVCRSLCRCGRMA
jgi:hypothetical protein